VGFRHLFFAATRACALLVEHQSRRGIPANRSPALPSIASDGRQAVRKPRKVPSSRNRVLSSDISSFQKHKHTFRKSTCASRHRSQPRTASARPVRILQIAAGRSGRLCVTDSACTRKATSIVQLSGLYERSTPWLVNASRNARNKNHECSRVRLNGAEFGCSLTSRIVI
jgi:hypothetical protein